MLFDDTMHDLAAHLSAYSLKVLVALPKRLDWRSWRRMPQADLATHLGMSKSRVCRALQELEQHGVLHSRGKGAAVEWRMSRVLGYRGRAAQYHQDGQEEACDRLEDVQVEDVPVAAIAAQPELPLRTPKMVFGRCHRIAVGLH